MTEQRKNRRFELRLPYEILSSPSRMKVSGETRNVSSSGVLFETETAFPLGEPIEYFITFPRQAGSRVEVRLRCVGKVVRQESETGYAASLDRYEFMRHPA
jgi:hypothetical protein